MSKIITWQSSQYSQSEIAQYTDSLYYAENVTRYMKFQSSVSLKYCLADAIRYTKNGQYVEVPKGSFLLTNNGSEMECLPNNSGGKVLFLYFTDALISDVYRSRCCPQAELLDNPGVAPESLFLLEHVYGEQHRLQARLHNLAQRISTEKAGKREMGAEVIYSFAEELLSMQQHLTRQMNRLPARSPAVREELFRRLLRAETFMRDLWQHDLHLDDLARHACLSPYHFHRTFRAAYGKSPVQWFRDLKLEKAKAMLASDKRSVREVALHCGFADVYSFSKAFKKGFGVNPSDSR